MLPVTLSAPPPATVPPWNKDLSIVLTPALSVTSAEICSGSCATMLPTTIGVVITIGVRPPLGPDGTRHAMSLPFGARLRFQLVGVCQFQSAAMPVQLIVHPACPVDV